jgi:hypothetical protein
MVVAGSGSLVFLGEGEGGGVGSEPDGPGAGGTEWRDDADVVVVAGGVRAGDEATGDGDYPWCPRELVDDDAAAGAQAGDLDPPGPAHGDLRHQRRASARRPRSGSDAEISIPDDLSVVSFDDTSAAATASPPLTAIRQPFAELGQIATRLLVDMAEGRPSVIDRVELTTALTLRSSTAPAPE